MKKKIFSVAIAVIAVVAGWNMKQNQNSIKTSTLVLANIEALARGETDPNEGKGMKKENCYNSNNVLIGTKCVRSASSTDVCNYSNQWGKCS